MLTVQQAQTHITACASAAQISGTAFYRACFLACTSIRLTNEVFWNTLSQEYANYYKFGLQGVHRQFTFGYKYALLEGLESSCDELWLASKQLTPEEFHELLCDMYGLRAIKAGFIVQLTTGALMCFESVHCALAGFDIRTFAARWNTKDGPARYREFIQDYDGPTTWRDYCYYVGTRAGFDPYRMSQAHVDFIQTGTYAPLSSIPLFA